MTNKDLYKLLQTVQKNVRCPQCGQEYGFEQMNIKGIVESVVFLELACTDHMPVLATIALNKGLKQKKSAKSQEKINSNDVIAAHQFLKNFSGSFEQIFKSTH